MKNSKFAIVIGAIALVIVVWTLTGFSEYELPYVTVKELKEDNLSQPGKRVKMGGTIVDGSRIETASGWRFELAQDELTVPVLYSQLTVPDMFHNDHVEIIVEGIYEKGEFQADNLLTKCASRYEGELEEEIIGGVVTGE